MRVMEKNLVDKGREKLGRGSEIVSLKMVKTRTAHSANMNCVCANGRNECDNRNLKTRGLWKGTAVSSANTNVNRSTGSSDTIIDDIQQLFLQFLIFHNRPLKDSTSETKIVRGSGKFLRSSCGIFDSD